MTTEQRITWLKIAAAVLIGLFAAERLVLSPLLLQPWKEQGERIALLREQIERGQLLLDRDVAIRERWTEMQRSDLPPNTSEAENELLKAIARWTANSRVSLTSLTPLWRNHEEGFQTLECRATATGSQAALGRFLYELETDPLAVRLETCEITARDDKGQQLTMNARFTALQLANLAAAR
jgi:hypothetical protein